MRNRYFLYIVVALFAGVVMSFGCKGGVPGSPSEGPPEEWEGPISSVSISGQGNMVGSVLNEEGLFYGDASDTTGGSGGPGEVDAISDTAIASCTFEFEPTTPGTSIQVRAPADPPCTSQNKCITCDVTSGGSCLINCTGWVPSNTATAIDYVVLKFKVTGEFNTTMPAADGAVRFDGDTSGWLEFDPTGASSQSMDVEDLALCDGAPVSEMTAVSSSNPLSLPAPTVTDWHTSWGFSFVGSPPPATCDISQKVYAYVYLTGADTGADINITDGTIYAGVKICDIADVAQCASPMISYFANTYGDAASGDEILTEAIPLDDGGFIAAGSTNSYGTGGTDGLVIRLYPDGTVIWENAYGTTANDVFTSIDVTADGGFIAAGYTYVGGSQDILVVKLNSSGLVQWQKEFDGAGSGEEQAWSIKEVSDGYVAVGETTSFAVPNKDIALIKLDSSGSLLWMANYGGDTAGTAGESAIDVIEASDGNYLISAVSDSFSASNDWLILKVSYVDGSVIWDRSYGDSSSDVPYSLYETSDGYYLAAGGMNISGNTQGLLLKLDDLTGDIVLQRAYGGSSIEFIRDVKELSTGEYLAAGQTFSYGSGMGDGFVVKVSSSDGSVDWFKAYGSSDGDDLAATEEIADGSLLIAGKIDDSFGDEWLILKADSLGGVGGSCDLITPVAESADVTSITAGDPTVSTNFGSYAVSDPGLSVVPTTVTVGGECVAGP